RLFIKCRTKNLSVGGGDVGGSAGFHRYQKEFIRIGVEKFHLSHGHARLLVHRYGSNVIDLYAYLLNVPPHTNLSDLDYVMLRYALEAEMCLHPLDFLMRRTDYFYFNKEQAIAIANHVIDEMAKYYQWSKSYHEQMITETWLALAN
ncbi:glycerol-3-phosphate dehydrogenase C-terminal domain-containing protein, partial [Vagococcus salmoninarum]